MAGPLEAAPGVGDSDRGRSRRRRLPDDDLLAVDEHPGQVEPGEVDARPGAARRLERVDHPRAGVEDGDPRVAHLARPRRRSPSSGPPERRRTRWRPPARPAREPAAPAPGRARAWTSDAGSASPRTSHQQVTARPRATTTATTASWAGPRASPARRPARRAACRPGTGTRGGSARPGSGRGTGGGRRRPPRRRRPGVVVPPGLLGEVLGRGRLGSRRPHPGQLVTEQRQPAGDGGLVLGAGSTGAHAPNLGRSGDLRWGVERRLWTTASHGPAVDDSWSAQAAAAPRRPRASPDRRGRRARHRARRTTPRDRRGCPPAARRASPAAGRPAPGWPGARP